MHTSLRRARTARGDVWTGAWVSLLQCPCPLPAPCPHPCLFLPGLNRHLWEFQAYASPFLTSPGRGLKLRVVGRGERGYLLPRARNAHARTYAPGAKCRKCGLPRARNAHAGTRLFISYPTCIQAYPARVTRTRGWDAKTASPEPCGLTRARSAHERIIVIPTEFVHGGLPRARNAHARKRFSELPGGV